MMTTNMSDILRSFLIFAGLVGLCSCVHTAPRSIAVEDRKTFVYVADVHDVPVDGEPRPDAWHHVHRILDKAGIRNFMESSSGVASIYVENTRRGRAEPNFLKWGKASIYVEPTRTNEASLLLAKDAVAKGYWISIDSVVIEGAKVNINIEK